MESGVGGDGADCDVCPSDHAGVRERVSRASGVVVLASSAIAEVFNVMLGQPLVAAHKMWWRFAV